MSQLTWWGFKWDTITRAVISPKVIFSKCLINPDVAAMYHTQNSRKQSLKPPPPSLRRPLEATFSGSPPGLAEVQHHQGVLADSIVQQPVSLPLAGLAVLSVSWGFCFFFCCVIWIRRRWSCCVHSVCVFLPGVFTNVYLTVKSSLSTTATLNVRIKKMTSSIDRWVGRFFLFLYLFSKLS